MSGLARDWRANVFDDSSRDLRDAFAQGSTERARDLALRKLRRSPDDLMAHHANMAAGFDLGVPQFLSSYPPFHESLARRQGEPQPPQAWPLIGRVIEQWLRRAEILVARFNQKSFDQPTLAFMVDQAKLLRDICRACDDTVLAAYADGFVSRFWQSEPSRAEEPLRTYWHPTSPISLQVEATNHCNLKCPMCPRTTAMTRPLGHLDVDLWTRILESWSGRETAHPIFNILTGQSQTIRLKGAIRMFFLGEFLMHPNFEELIRIAAAKNAETGIQTNGVLLTRSSLRRRLLDAQPAVVSISLDGFDATTYETARAGSRWSTAKAGIEAFLSDRDRRGLQKTIKVSLATILPDDNPATKEKVQGFLSTLYDGSLAIEFLQLTSANPATFFDGDGHVKDVGYKPGYVVRPELPSCFEPLEKMQILWDGRVAACCIDVNGRIDLGRAEVGVDDVWNGAEFTEFKRAHLNHRLGEYELCQACLGVDAGCRPVARETHVSERVPADGSRRPLSSGGDATRR
jgi:hypothetical protein